MPIHGYPGNVITANPTAPTSSVASGVWTTEQQLLAQAAGNWPLPGPPQPISRSLRFNTNDSTYLSRSPASAGNQKTWTWSTWVKPSRFASQQPLFNSYSSATNYGLISFSASGYIDANDTLKFIVVVSNSQQLNFQTSALYRDPSAWYHIVIALDTTQATNTNRVKIYVNGVQVTAFSTATYPTQNLDVGLFNTTNQHQIGALATGTYGFFSGYMTEMYFINGQQLTPSSFGQTNTSTGVWEPIAYTGTYGTNGFYLNFSDNSGTTSTTLGKDSSGNGNNWTPNNFSVTAGSGNDSLVDSPTNYGTDTGVGGEVRGNYATFNPITGGSSTTSNGNLDGVFAPINGARVSTIAVTSGKWYAEFVATSISSGYSVIGIGAPYLKGWNATQESNANCVIKWNHTNGGTAVGSWTMPTSSLNFTYTTGDLIGVALDMTTNTVTYYKNGSNVGNFTFTTGAAGSPVEVCFLMGHSDGSVNGAGYVNFGQRPFAYTAPSGFKALCTQNLPTPTIGATSTTQANDYFDVSTWSGTGGSSRSITGINFQPDFVWGKVRNTTYGHMLFDAVRGAGSNKELGTNVTGAEGYGSSSQYGYLSAFNSNGFTVTAGTDGSIPNAYWNQSGNTYVGWQWKANGAGSTNTAGTITSTVSANTTAGFSISTYTGNGSSSQTVGHGLGVALGMVIIKTRSNSDNWRVWHTSLTSGQTLTLNSTAAQAASGFWPSNPSTSVVYLGTDSSVNSSTWTYVMYSFAPVAGYSAFGSYTGNGSSDGPFVYVGFRPRYFMAKRTDAAGNSWILLDTARNTYNAVDAFLSADLPNAEATSYPVDFLSNGFKIRATTSNLNASSGTYIYMAFAESPFKYALAR